MRATQAPEQWQLVLDAVNAGNYELANELVVKYKFVGEVSNGNDFIRDIPLKGDCVAMDTDGKIYCHESGRALSRHLGLSPSYVNSAIIRLEKYGGLSLSGRMEGWKFWKEV